MKRQVLNRNMFFFFSVYGPNYGAGVVGCKWNSLACSFMSAGSHGSKGTLPNGKLPFKDVFYSG